MTITKEIIREVIKQQKEGVPYVGIAKSTGITANNVAYVMAQKKLYKRTGKGVAYGIPLAEVLEKQPVKAAEEAPASAPEASTNGLADDLAKLDLAFSSFQQSVVDYIDAEVEKRSGDRIRALEEELSIEREAHKKTVEKYEDTLKTLKGMSFSGMVRRKFERV